MQFGKRAWSAGWRMEFFIKENNFPSWTQIMVLFFFPLLKIKLAKLTASPILKQPHFTLRKCFTGKLTSDRSAWFVFSNSHRNSLILKLVLAARGEEWWRWKGRQVISFFDLLILLIVNSYWPKASKLRSPVKPWVNCKVLSKCFPWRAWTLHLK